MAEKDTPEKGYRPDLWEKGKDGKYEFKGSAQMAMKHPLLPPEIREFKTAKPSRGGGGGGSGGGSGNLGGGAGATGADLLHTMNPQKLMKKGGSVGASKRGDGIAQRGKTKGRLL